MGGKALLFLAPTLITVCLPPSPFSLKDHFGVLSGEEVLTFLPFVQILLERAPN